MIHVTGQTPKFHAIKFVKAIRRATGAGLADGLEQVRRLSEGESIRIEPAGAVTDQELAAWLEDCGVVVRLGRASAEGGGD